MSPQASTPSTGADLILTRGRITTLDRRRPSASSVAVKDGRFLSVGSDADVMEHRSETTRVIDLRGRVVIPGLNDSHVHVIRGGLNYMMELRWDGVRSLAEAMRMLRDQARRTMPPQWVRVVGGFTEWQFSERRLPNRAGPSLTSMWKTRLSSGRPSWPQAMRPSSRRPPSR